jgi:hypothetical protein
VSSFYTPSSAWSRASRLNSILAKRDESKRNNNDGDNEFKFAFASSQMVSSVLADQTEPLTLSAPSETPALSTAQALSRTARLLYKQKQQQQHEKEVEKEEAERQRQLTKENKKVCFL